MEHFGVLILLIGMCVMIFDKNLPISILWEYLENSNVSVEIEFNLFICLIANCICNKAVSVARVLQLLCINILLLIKTKMPSDLLTQVTWHFSFEIGLLVHFCPHKNEQESCMSLKHALYKLNSRRLSCS